MNLESTVLSLSSELFGTSETDGDEDGFDHSEDAENGNVPPTISKTLITK